MSKNLNTSRLQGFVDEDSSFVLDLSGMPMDPAVIASLTTREDWEKGTPPPPVCERAHQGMKDIEAGAIKNPNEGRKVTHFTDRQTYCESALYFDVASFAQAVAAGTLRGGDLDIEFVIINGIGGSALGPQLMQFAINGPYWNELSDYMRNGFPRIYFLDNTDSTGLQDVLDVVDLELTLVVTISKSGGTKETRNNMRALEKAYAEEEVDFASHAVAVTMEGSALFEHASREPAWLKIFPMAESIGGRTSETNIVGHVPAALAGIDFKQFVQGAKHMDDLTRAEALEENPAYQLALAWYIAGNGRGDRNMVIVPYADRLVLLARYLQQLVMESLGKERALDGRKVNQGLNVFGNKGGTDAHAYIQQLNDGRDDFFVTFIGVLDDTLPMDVDDGLTMGDYLHAFRQGLTNALTGKNRQVITILIDELSPFTLGMLIALYERAVAYYAELIGINAFHQPGVQSYKLASNRINEINHALRKWMADLQETPWTGSAKAVADDMGTPDDADEIEQLLATFAVNQRSFGGVNVMRSYDDVWTFTFCKD